MKASLRSGLTVLLTVFALVGGTSVARADLPEWLYAKCTRGTLLYAKNGGEHNAVVVGSSSLCLLELQKTSFGVAVYKAGATVVNVLSANLREYPRDLGLRTFGAFVSDEPGTFGVCLLASPTRKIACGKVVFHNSGYVEFTTIQPTDALVNARVDDSQIAVDPRCGACF